MSPELALMSFGVKERSPFLFETLTTCKATLSLAAGAILLIVDEDWAMAPPARSKEVVMVLVSCIVTDFVY